MARFQATHLRERVLELGLTRVAQLAQLCVGEAIRLAPVDTGELRQSIRGRQINRYTWRVTAHAPHALYVELGTQNGRAQPYLRPALRKVLGR